MQVADVGRRSACSSMPGTPALHSRGDKKKMKLGEHYANPISMDGT